MPATISRGARANARRPDRRGARALTALAIASLLLSLPACSDASAPPEAPPMLRYAAATTAAAPVGDVIPDEYIVVFRDSVRDVPARARELAASVGGTLRFTYTSAIKGFAAHVPAAAVDALSRNPMVAHVEADQVVRIAGTQTSPWNWGLDRIDQAALPLDNTYNYPNTAAGVNIYIIDSGIRTTHREFGGRAFGAYTAINDGHGTDDCYYHGTGVASIAGGERVGVAKQATLWAVRIFDCTGGSSSSALLAGIDWVTKNRKLPAVANMSLSTASSSTVNDAVNASIASGVTYVAAAGNYATDACAYSPASDPAVITVAGSTSADAQMSVSDYGKCVDVYAPGATIRLADITTDSSYAAGTGTSFATPHAAGVAAMYLAAHPTASAAEVGSAIVSGATPGVLTALGPGSPNLLLNVAAAGVVTSTPAPSPDTTTTTTTTPPPPTDTTTSTPSTPSVVDAPPTASFTVACKAARSKCSVDGSGSTDDHGVVSYTWNFGDGSTPITLTTPSALYTYARVGSYTITLEVRDAAGQSSTTTHTVTVKRM